MRDKLRIRVQIAVAALLVATWSGRSVAQVSLSPDETAKIDHARRLRRAGIGLSIAAIATEAATLALWGATIGIIDDTHSRYGEYHAEPAAYWPVFGLAVATSTAVPLLLAVGIPLWSVGAQSSYKRERGLRH